jgi:aspartate/methionine/tyrosine aminotransferase
LEARTAVTAPSGREILLGEIRRGLRAFCLERWQSLHENYARVNLSDSGVAPLTLAELEELGLDLGGLRGLELGYGWTRGSPELRSRISELYGGEVGEGEILVTAGSAEANLAAAMSLVEEGDLVGVDVPNYMQVPGLVRFLGARARELKRTHPSWRFPVGEAVRFIEEEKPKVVFVCNPNNPTATVLRESEVEEMAEAARRAGALLVFDEVYWGSEQGGDRPSALEIAGKDVALSVCGLSKVYGMPGLRLGWLAGRRDLVERAWAVKDYVSIAPSILSDRIASTVLTRDNVAKLRKRAREIVKGNFELLLKTIDSDLLQPLPVEGGAFAWAKVPWAEDTLSLCELVFARRGVLVNPGECFENPGFLRIGLGQRQESFAASLRELVEALREARSTLERASLEAAAEVKGC